MGKRGGGRGRIKPTLTELDKLELGLSVESSQEPDVVVSNRIATGARYSLDTSLLYYTQSWFSLFDTVVAMVTALALLARSITVNAGKLRLTREIQL